MKILYQHRTLADGAEGIHIAEMVEAFQTLGHHVQVLSLASPKQRGEGRPGIWGRLKATLPAWLFELGAIAFNVVDYVGFRRALRRSRPDLVYKRHAMYDVGIVLASRHEGVPVILEVNCPYSSEQHRKFERVCFPPAARALERLAFSRASVVATVSSPLGRLIREIGGSRARVVVVPNGANPQRFQPLSPPPDLRSRFAPPGAMLVGWVGILRSWHRVDLLLEAVAHLESVHLVVIGDGPDQSRLEDLAAYLKIADRVCFTGRVAHKDMPNHIATFDVAVAADDRTGYASPMKLLEYMAMAKPVVAPRLPNIEDFIEDGVDGLLFAPGSSADLARTLQTLTADPLLMQLCGHNARLKIERDRNWVAIASRVLAEVRDVQPAARPLLDPVV